MESKIKNKTEVKLGKKPISKIGFFKMMYTYYKQFWLSWVILIIFTLITSAITVAIPKITNIIFQELSQGAINNEKPVMPWNVLSYWALGFAMSFIVSGIFVFCRGLVSGRIAKKIEIEIRLKVLNKLIDLDMAYYFDKKMGDILTKLISDTQIIGDQTSQIPTNFLNALFTFVGSIAILFTLNNVVTTIAPDGQIIKTSYASTEYTLAGIVLGVASLILLITIFLFSIFRKRVFAQRKVLSNINGDVNDRINSVKLIKTTGTVDYEKNRFEEVHKKYYSVSLSAIRLQSFIMSFIITTFSSMNIIAIIVSIIFINEGKLDPTIMISFTMAINSLVMPILQVVRMIGNLASASTSAGRVNDILVQEPKISTNPEGERINGIDGSIIFKDVNFAYEADKPLILENFNFEFKKGNSYAIVGETGVGKSTIAQLLLKTYEPLSGQIFINNNLDLHEINLKSYLDNVGYVEQEPQILYGNFWENIKYGYFNSTNEEVIVACKKANIYDFINSLPDKFDTVLGERGFILSGGQKQRLVIARMFLRNPNILILDEATSALDNIVEKEIQAELNKLMEGRTTIVIAHRLSTIKNVDQILVLEKGKGIVQIGTFTDLKTAQGRFKSLYEAGLMD